MLDDLPAARHLLPTEQAVYTIYVEIWAMAGFFGIVAIALMVLDGIRNRRRPPAS